MRDDADLNREDAAAVDDPTAAQDTSELWEISASLQELSGYLASLTKQPLDQDGPIATFLSLRCETCTDTGWVCETHCNRPWDGQKACGCGAAGMPCIICNADGHVSRVLKSVLAVRGKKVQ